MYCTDFDADRRILTITVEGFWTFATVGMFSAKMIALGTSLKLRHGDYAILNDARAFPVQSAEIIRALDFLTIKSMGITRGPTATVVPTVLGKMQADRIMTSENNRVFLGWDEAVAWLDEVWLPRNAA